MMGDQRLIISGMPILINRDFVDHLALIIESGLIKAIIHEEMIAHHLPAQHLQFSAKDYLVPGFIDMHIHGAGGADVMDAAIPALHTISQSLAAEGVTGFLATTMTESEERINAALAVIPAAMQQVTGAAILGVHLEGPFISTEKIGAQHGVHVRLPDIELFNRLQHVSGNQIRVVTVAPELENAIPFISSLIEQEVIAAIGHTNATYDITMKAIAAGASYATHLFNAMRGLQQREPGAAGALLLSDAVSAELIADGKHLHPAVCQLAYRMKGKDHLLLVTDAMRAKCMPEGQYELGGQEVMVKDGKVTLMDGTLAGSVLTMPMALNKMQKYTRATLAEACRMASYNPAKALRLLSRKGTIETGKDADLVVLNHQNEVQLTLRGGRIIFSARLSDACE